MRRILLLLLTLTIACIDDEITGSTTINGAYTLRSINGSPLPFTYTTGGTTTEILDHVITLYQGFTYAESGHSRKTVNNQVMNETISKSGSYTLLGTSVTLRSSDGESTISTISGNTMTIVIAGRTATYTK